MVSTVLKQHLSAKQQAAHQAEQVVYQVKYFVEIFALTVIAVQALNVLLVKFVLTIHVHAHLEQFL